MTFDRGADEAQGYADGLQGFPRASSRPFYQDADFGLIRSRFEAAGIPVRIVDRFGRIWALPLAGDVRTLGGLTTEHDKGATS